MKQEIQLAAMILRDGRLWLLRRSPDARWELPGGPFDGDDVDAEMDGILDGFGISAPAIEEDFVETIHMPREGGAVVFNLYAPTDWTGEPLAAPGVGSGWFAIDELEAIAMEPAVRDAIHGAFGLRPAVDRTAEFVSALNARSEVPFSLFGGEASRASVKQRIERDYREVAPGALAALSSVAEAAIDGRTRSLAATAVLIALGRGELLGEHITEAINAGATGADVIAIVRLVSAYAGFAAAVAAWPEVERALAAHGQLPEASRR